LKLSPHVCAVAFVILLIVPGCAGVATTTNAGVPTTTALFSRYDRIRGRTTVRATVFYHDLQLDVAVVHRDSLLADPAPAVFWVFKTLSWERSAFVRDPDLSLLVDDTLRFRYRGRGDFDVGRGGVADESSVVSVPVADMARISRAATVEGIVGTKRFTLTPSEIIVLREMTLFARRDPAAPRPHRGRDF
jgi:hypothetical protein